MREFLLRVIRNADVYERQAANISARLIDEMLALCMSRFGYGQSGLPRMVHDLAGSLGKDECTGQHALKKPESPAVLALN